MPDHQKLKPLDGTFAQFQTRLEEFISRAAVYDWTSECLVCYCAGKTAQETVEEINRIVGNLRQ